MLRFAGRDVVERDVDRAGPVHQLGERGRDRVDRVPVDRQADVHVARVDGDFPTRGEPSTPITVDLELEGDAPEAKLRELVDLVDRIAEIPNSIRGTTPVTLGQVKLEGGQA